MKNQEQGYCEFRFELYPGIYLDYFTCDGTFVFAHDKVRMDRSMTNNLNILLINYCYRGGFEGKLENGRSIYRGEKQLTLSCPASLLIHSRIPQGVYEAVSLTIDQDQIPLWLQQFFQYSDIDLPKIIERYDLKAGWFRFPVEQPIEHDFNRLYQHMETGDIVSMRMTALKIINCINFKGQQNERRSPDLPIKTYRLVQQIGRKLEDPANFNRSIKELVATENISYPTFLKIFKELYLMTPSQYCKKHRLNHGAFLLKYTSNSITEIAANCGYDNASKFSVAFKKVMNLSPLMFRRYEGHTD